ncbi:hypothetical protein IAU59_004614 [Kwoniella sp. CBS 9459]
MKRLFRTSKSPVVDPLPPPPLSAPSSGTSTPTHYHHEHRWPFGHSHQNEVTPFPIDAGRETAGPGQGQNSLPPPPQQQHLRSSSGRHGKDRIVSGGGSGGNGIHSVPSLLEIQQMQEREQAMRSGQSVPPRQLVNQPQNQQQQQQQQQQHQRRTGGGSYGSATPSPDGWTVVSPQTNVTPISSNGFDPPYHSPSTEPLPIPQAAFANSQTSSIASPSSASTHTALYLPPGARPATPPSTRPPYAASSARHSQASLSSLSTAQAQYSGIGKGHPDEMVNMIPPQTQIGRERGHSVASATGSVSARSDHDSSVSGSHATHSTSHFSSNNPFLNNNNNNSNTVNPNQNNNPNSPSKLQKPNPQVHPSRSPLAKSYPIPEPITSFPSPHPYNQSQPANRNSNPNIININAQATATPPDSMPNPFPPSNEEMSTAVPPPSSANQAQNSSNLFRRVSLADHKDGKEKKRGLWGMGKNWTKGKEKKEEKDKNRERRESHLGVEGDWSRQSVDEPRRSHDGWRDNESQPSSTHGHSTTQGHEQEEAPRGRLLGLDFGGGRKEKETQPQPHHMSDVTTAIHMLCTMQDPPPANIYEVCDRINTSADNDSIAKEAARALRKEFKHGNEGERRNAAKVWLILMRNIQTRGFRQNASSRKFFSSMEPILLASTQKPLVSANTHRLLTDILADLTFSYGMEKGCDGLVEMWKRVKLPQEPDFGNPLPADHPIFGGEPMYPNQVQWSQRPPSHANSLGGRRASSPSLQQHQSAQQGMQPPAIPPRGASPGKFGHGYTDLPSHGEDIRRLVDECTAAKESARVLTEALVYTRPEELEHKPIIGEFYRKVFLAHESLTNQMDWAQAEAARSRERHANLTLDSGGNANAAVDTTKHDTPEERALATLFEAHGALSEALKQHDELDRLGTEEKELREVRERSKKETRMDRNQPMYDQTGGLAVPGTQVQASSSRSPSPVPHSRLPSDPAPKITSSPRNYDIPLPPPGPGNANGTGPFKGPYTDIPRSRTPSPDSHPLPQPPRIPGSPGQTRTSSPLGRLRMGGPRPLPNPFANAKNAGQHSLAPSANGPASTTGAATPSVPASNGPSRTGTGETPSRSGTGSTADELDEDGDNLPAVPLKPSRKALGKRRAVVDEENNFDPNDMFAPNPSIDPRSRPNADGDQTKGDSDSEESLTADSLLNPNGKAKKPIVYAYDAYEERQKELKRAEEALKTSGGSGGGGSRAGGGSGAGSAGDAAGIAGAGANKDVGVERGGRI